MGQIKEHSDSDSDHVYGSNARGSPVRVFHMAQSTASDYFVRKTCSLCSFYYIVSCTDITERVIFSLMGWNRPSGHVLGFYTECEFQYLKVRPFVMVSVICLPCPGSRPTFIHTIANATGPAICSVIMHGDY